MNDTTTPAAEIPAHTDCPHCDARFPWGTVSNRASADDREAANGFLGLSRHIDEAHADKKHHCPRGPAPGGPFKAPFDGSAFYTIDQTCSYCGSLSEEAFFAAIDAGAELGPTDKSYKVYVDLAEPFPDAPAIRMSSSGGRGEAPAGEGWIKGDDPRAVEVHSRYGGLGGDPDSWVKIETRGPKRFGKFYFQHLSEAGQQRFVDLLNERKLNIGAPGHFYTRPFFCVPVKPSEVN